VLRFLSIDYPGDASGHIVGAYIDSAGKRHGFLLLGGRQSAGVPGIEDQRAHANERPARHIHPPPNWTEPSMFLAMHNGITPHGSLLTGLYTDSQKGESGFQPLWLSRTAQFSDAMDSANGATSLENADSRPYAHCARWLDRGVYPQKH